MKRFSQFLGIHQGSKHFKQAPNAILVQDWIFNKKDNIWNPAINPIELGSISSSTGGESSSTTRLRNVGYIKVEPNTTYMFECNVERLFIIEFSEQGVKPVDSSGWKTVPFTYTTSADTKYIRFTIANQNNTTITVNDFKWLTIKQVKE